MAKFNLTGSKTVAELKKEFNEAFGSCINVYNGRNKAEDSETLGNLGLKADTEFECRSSRTVGSFKVAFAKMGLKVKVFTKDNWVTVLDGITLETSGKIPNQSTTEKMKEFLAYKREEKNSVEDLGDSQIYAKLDFDEIWIAREHVSESDVIDRYQKGKQEIFKQAIRNAIYDSCNDTVEIGWQLGEKIDFENGHGAIYADNVYEEKVTNDRGFTDTIVKYKFPCTILVVADGKIIDKMIFENAPETHEGYLFSDISYLYDLDELKDRLDCEDTEWFEEDMISLMNDVEEDDDWTRSYEIGDCGDGLYVSDLENYFYSVVIDGEIVFGWDE